MLCENCGSEHIGNYGSGRFCSKKCARGFSTKSKRREINEKVSKLLTGDTRCGWAKGTKQSKEIIERRMSGYTKEKRAIAISKTVEIRRRKLEERVQKLPFEMLSSSIRKKIILKEQNNKCNRCDINIWLGNPITLELEHKDGNCDNNIRNNLECLCPNCHSQTPTWKRGKNKKKRFVSDEVLLESLRVSNNFKSALENVGLTGKGYNYVRCYKLALKNNLGDMVK